MLKQMVHTVTLSLCFTGLNMSMDRTVQSRGNTIEFYSEGALLEPPGIPTEDFCDFPQFF
jgi:hypothetical protein